MTNTAAAAHTLIAEWATGALAGERVQLTYASATAAFDAARSIATDADIRPLEIRQHAPRGPIVVWHA